MSRKVFPPGLSFLLAPVKTDSQIDVIVVYHLKEIRPVFAELEPTAESSFVLVSAHIYTS